MTAQIKYISRVLFKKPNSFALFSGHFLILPFSKTMSRKKKKPDATKKNGTAKRIITLLITVFATEFSKKL